MRTLADILFWIGRFEHVLLVVLLIHSLVLFRWRRDALRRWSAAAWLCLFALLSAVFWPGVLSKAVDGVGYIQAHLYGGIWRTDEALSNIVARWRHVWLPCYAWWLGLWLGGLIAIWLGTKVERRLAQRNTPSPRQFGFGVLQPVGSALALGLLLFSWYACYLSITAMTEGWGAPWDTTSIRPPTGYWQRSLNDFFESGIGAYLPAAGFLAVSLLLYIRTLARTRAVWMTSFAFATTNLVALVALIAFGIPIQTLLVRAPAYLTPQDWSYWGDFRREWPLALVALALFAGLLLLQPRLARRLTRVVGSE